MTCLRACGLCWLILIILFLGRQAAVTDFGDAILRDTSAIDFKLETSTPLRSADMGHSVCNDVPAHESLAVRSGSPEGMLPEGSGPSALALDVYK
jgi:hypothetical protein